MTISLRRIGLITLLGCLALPPLANAQSKEPRITAARTLWALPYAVEMQTHESGAAISGSLLKSTANPSRRFYGQVYVEMLDANGEVIAVHQASPKRVGQGRHAQRARFEIEIEAVPHDVDSVRVSYR